VDASLDVAARPQANTVSHYTGCARRFVEQIAKPLEAISGKDVQDCMLGLVGRERRRATLCQRSVDRRAEAVQQLGLAAQAPRVERERTIDMNRPSTERASGPMRRASRLIHCWPFLGAGDGRHFGTAGALGGDGQRGLQGSAPCVKTLLAIGTKCPTTGRARGRPRRVQRVSP